MARRIVPALALRIWLAALFLGLFGMSWPVAGQAPEVLSGPGTYQQGEATILLDLADRVAVQVDPTARQVTIQVVIPSAQVTTSGVMITIAVGSEVSAVVDITTGRVRVAVTQGAAMVTVGDAAAAMTTGEVIAVDVAPETVPSRAVPRLSAEQTSTLAAPSTLLPAVPVTAPIVGRQVSLSPDP